MTSMPRGTGWARQALLLCGILAPLLQMATDRLAGMRVAGYDFSAQSMSELSAAGSPVRSLVVTLGCLANLLMVAFGVGVWRAEGLTVLSRVVAVLVIGNAVFGVVATVFFPTRFGERPAFGSVGVILMFLSVLCFVLAMIVGAVAFGGWLRILSIGIPVGYIELALARFLTASASVQAASMVGVQERTMGFSYLIWIIALAVHLLLFGAGIV